jgi:DNA polymerase-3 subunit alpha
MAALMTSVMGSTSSIFEYIYCCRRMGIDILAPDINEGIGRFRATGKSIRYGMSAIKGVGKAVIDEIVSERENGGFYTSLKDFCLRLQNKSINKRTIESLIKAGALDTLPGTRKQKMCIYLEVMDTASQESKAKMTGQVSLFELIGEEEKEEWETALPDVGEYDIDQILSFEKEVLGVYISGHPLEEDEELLSKNITRTAKEFMIQEGNSAPIVKDGENAVIGGLVVGKTIKSTKNNTIMAFVTIEDMFGTVEVIVFPKDFERYRSLLEEDRKLFVKGRVNVEEDKPAKLICATIIPFEEVPCELWIQYPNKESFTGHKEELYRTIGNFDGKDKVTIYLKEEKAKKQLPNSQTTKICRELLEILFRTYGKDNVKVVQKSIEKVG